MYPYILLLSILLAISGCKRPKAKKKRARKPPRPPQSMPVTSTPYARSTPKSGGKPGVTPKRPNLSSRLAACLRGNPMACDDVNTYFPMSSRHLKEAPVLHRGLRELCDAKNPAACALLGRHELSSHYTHLERANAFSHIEAGCTTSGAKVACLVLARILQYGDGITKNLDKATTLYGEACAQKVGSACLLEATLLAHRAPLTPPTAEVQRLMRAACRNGTRKACRLIECATRPKKSAGHIATRPKKFRDLFEYLITMCTAGNHYACHLRARFEAEGLGKTQNYVKAQRALKKLCDQGDVHSCIYLGVRYQEGFLGAKPEPLTAAALLKTGCEKGSPMACGRLGLLELDHKEAAVRAQGIKHLEFSCKSGGYRACAQLGQLSLRGGAGLPKSPVVAVGHFSKACAMGDLDSCAMVAITAATHPAAAPASPWLDKRRLTPLCALGDVRACAAVALLETQNNSKASMGKALALSRRACSCSIGLACRVIGLAYERGTTKLSPSPVAAEKYFQKGCVLEDPHSCYRLALLNLKGGDTIPLNKPRGERLAKKACTLGHNAACSLAATPPTPTGGKE